MVVSGHTTRSGTRTGEDGSTFPQNLVAHGSEGVGETRNPTKGLGRSMALEGSDVMEARLWLLPSVRSCRAVPGPEAWVWNSSVPPVSPPLAGTRGPSVITKESVASVQGPCIPSRELCYHQPSTPSLIELCYMTVP